MITALTWIILSVTALWVLSNVHMSLRAATMFGIPSRRSVGRMLTMDVERSIETFGVHRASFKTVAVTWSTLGLLFTGLWLWNGVHLFGALAAFTVVFLSGRAVSLGVPPAILTLGASGPTAEGLHRSMQEAMGHFPRVVSLLDFSEENRELRWRAGPNPVYFGVFRTRNEFDWHRTVASLIEICPVLVVDCRHPTPTLAEEIQMIDDLAALGKTRFIVDRTAAIPTALNPIVKAGIQDVPGSQFTTEAELVDWVRGISTSALGTRTGFRYS
jgi:hypothetical protein